MPISNAEKQARFRKKQELKKAIKNYLNWISMHLEGSGVKTASFNTLKSSLHLYDQKLSSHVVFEIKKRIFGDATAEGSELTLAARVFLYFAQEFDRQSQEVDCDLKSFRQKEEDLIRALKMEDDDLAGELQNKQTQTPNTSADYLVADRLEAWTRIFLKDTEGSDLFVTHNQAVLDYLLDYSLSAEKLVQYETIPLDAGVTADRDSWRSDLMTQLGDLMENAGSLPAGGRIEAPDFPDAENTLSLSIYRMPDQLPREFFSRCAGIKPDTSDPMDRPGRFKHTLIGLIEL